MRGKMLTPEQAQAIIDARAKGLTHREIQQLTGFNRVTIGVVLGQPDKYLRRAQRVAASDRVTREPSPHRGKVGYCRRCRRDVILPCVLCRARNTPPQEFPPDDDRPPAADDPTPEEIAQRCESLLRGKDFVLDNSEDFGEDLDYLDGP